MKYIHKTDNQNPTYLFLPIIGFLDNDLKKECTIFRASYTTFLSKHFFIIFFHYLHFNSIPGNPHILRLSTNARIKTPLKNKYWNAN